MTTGQFPQSRETKAESNSRAAGILFRRELVSSAEPVNNKRQRRQALRDVKRLTRRPEACKTLDHPLLHTRTPYGANLLRRRRAHNAAAKVTRLAQYRQAALSRRHRQRKNKRAA